MQTLYVYGVLHLKCEVSHIVIFKHLLKLQNSLYVTGPLT